MGQKYYYRIKFNPGFDRQAFNDAKKKGVLQRDYEDIRKSLDGKEALLGVEGEQKPVADGLILSRYTPEEAFQYIEANAANWKLVIPTAEPKVPARGILQNLRAAWVGSDSVITPLPTEPKVAGSAWRWLAVAACVAALGAALYWWLR